MAERLADLRTPDGEVPDERYDPPPPPKPNWKERLRANRPERPKLLPKPPKLSGDMILGGLGVVLGLVCALFPWYIFMNP
jgi:hypothetical protein